MSEQVNAPKSLELINDIKAGKKIMCPKCGSELAYKGNSQKITYIFCTNPKCNGKIVIN